MFICHLTCSNLIYLTLFPLFVLPQIDIQSEVQVALQSPPQGGCREVATILACVQVLLLLLHNDNISKASNTHLTCVLNFELIKKVCARVQRQSLCNFGSMQDTMKAAEDKVKLFLLQSALLKKLPLKYRAHTVNSSLLDEFCKAKDGKVYPFHEVSRWDHCNLT